MLGCQWLYDVVNYRNTVIQTYCLFFNAHSFWLRYILARFVDNTRDGTPASLQGNYLNKNALAAPREGGNKKSSSHLCNQALLFNLKVLIYMAWGVGKRKGWRLVWGDPLVITSFIFPFFCQSVKSQVVRMFEKKKLQ